MKTEFENNFKQSLENYEFPYDEKAWDAMSNRLDKVMPVKRNPWKLWFFSGISALGILSVLVYSYNSQIVNEKSEISNQATKTENNSSSIVEKDMHSTPSELKEIKKVEEKNQKITKESEIILLSSKEIKQESTLVKQLNSYVIKPTNEESSNNNKRFHSIPNIADVCLGEKIKIENTNENDIVIIHPSNKHSVIEANKTAMFQPNNEGEYQIGYYSDDKFELGDKFIVKSTGVSDFVVDNDRIYNENELPTVFLRANSPGSEYEWSIDKQTYKSANKDFEVHLYKKGSYTITLTTINQNGCKSHDSKTVKVAEDYNLLAVSGFDPYSTNPKTNSFIPYALTKRDVRFTMLIFDITGREIFKTNNSHEPWNGIDPLTNEIVKTGSVFIWKVVLENPEEGEKSQYSGNITVISK